MIVRKTYFQSVIYAIAVGITVHLISFLDIERLDGSSSVTGIP